MKSLARSMAVVLWITSVTVVPATVTAVVTTGCAGQKARTHTLIPALQLASHGVEADAVEGVKTLPAEAQEEASTAISAFFGIIRSGDEVAIRSEAIVLWGRVQELVEAGISSKVRKGTVSPQAAVLLRGRASDFGEQLRAFIVQVPAFSG